MNSVIVLCFLALVAIASARPESYTDRFDNIDIEAIINNKKLMEKYVACVLDQGKCTAEGRELKSHIREALENECAKCTEVQRKGTRTVIGHLINHDEKSWQQLVAKYDPQRRYVVKYEKDLRSIKA